MIVHTYLAGAKHHPGALAHLAEAPEHSEIELRRERDNRFDANAVAVFQEGRKLGFLPATENRDIAAALDAGVEVAATMTVESVTRVLVTACWG